MLVSTKKKLDAKKDVALGDIKLFDTFAWLLSPADAVTQRQWVNIALKGKGSVACANSANGPPEVVPPVKVEKKRADVGADTMCLFKTKKA